MIKIHPVRSLARAKGTSPVRTLARLLRTGQKVIVIVGPTASGKSDLAIKTAKKHNGEIISADSRQVYREMDVGTGKVAKDATLPVPKLKVKSEKLKVLRKDFYSEGVRHHLIDVANPKKQFTADDFKKLGEKAIKEILAKGKVPIIVGGTGFYIDVLLGKMAIAQVPPNKKLRAKLEKQSAEQLFRQLYKLAPEQAKTIDRYNKRRLIRALEIAPSQHNSQSKKMSLSLAYAKFRDINNYKILWLGIRPEKEKLAKRIKERLDARLKQGMIKEVEKLHKQGISWKRLDDFGLEYRWVSRWLKNSKFQAPNYKQITSSKFQKSDEYKNLLRDIIRYSKRQMTWFKRNKDIKWVINPKTAEHLTRRFLD